MAILQDLRPKIETEKRLEKTRMQLVQSSKLASIGRLAAGVAHEINNPLGGIVMYGHLVLEDLPKEGNSYKNQEKLIAQAERCKSIVKGLLDFSRQREPKIETIDINNIIEDLLSLVERQSIFQNIEITTVLDPNLPLLEGDKSQLQQVFLNLTLNAAEAMAEGGDLTVKTSLFDGTVAIEFIDTGCGIPAEDTEKIFEPFFTTKSAKRGTGLGLAVSHGIINKHKGTISFDSRVNEGTTFTVRLPVGGV
jgi:signal transduction histidine kinase